MVRALLRTAFLVALIYAVWLGFGQKWDYGSIYRLGLAILGLVTLFVWGQISVTVEPGRPCRVKVANKGALTLKDVRVFPSPNLTHAAFGFAGLPKTFGAYEHYSVPIGITDEIPVEFEIQVSWRSGLLGTKVRPNIVKLSTQMPPAGAWAWCRKIGRIFLKK